MLGDFIIDGELLSYTVESLCELFEESSVITCKLVLHFSIAPQIVL